jgi:hypothetical protein
VRRPSLPLFMSPLRWHGFRRNNPLFSRCFGFSGSPVGVCISLLPLGFVWCVHGRLTLLHTDGWKAHAISRDRVSERLRTGNSLTQAGRWLSQRYDSCLLVRVALVRMISGFVIISTDLFRRPIHGKS